MHQHISYGLDFKEAWIGGASLSFSKEPTNNDSVIHIPLYDFSLETTNHFLGCVYQGQGRFYLSLVLQTINGLQTKRIALKSSINWRWLSTLMENGTLLAISIEVAVLAHEPAWLKLGALGIQTPISKPVIQETLQDDHLLDWSRHSQAIYGYVFEKEWVGLSLNGMYPVKRKGHVLLFDGHHEPIGSIRFDMLKPL